MSTQRNTQNKNDKQTSPRPKWEQNLIDLASKDVNAARNEYLFPAPEFLTSLLNIQDKDLALWYNVYDCGLLTIINLLLIKYIFYSSHWCFIALLSIIRVISVGVPRFILALHYSSHLPIIQPQWFNNLLIEFLIVPFFGLPPGVYRFHHVIMHHREDNQYPYDLSSTMPYNRGSILSYFHYWIRFEFGIWFELPYYLYWKGYYGWFIQSVFCMLLWIFGNYYLYNYIRPAIALWLFLIPQFLCSMALMAGNFGQHIFIDPDNVTDDHRLTVNLINTPYNQLTFNDGYHIIHHKYPKLHWSEMPKRFITQRELDLHSKNDAICLKDTDFFMLAAHVWFGLWNKLAKKHFVPSNQKQADMDNDQVIKFLKSRLIKCI